MLGISTFGLSKAQSGQFEMSLDPGDENFQKLMMAADQDGQASLQALADAGGGRARFDIANGEVNNVSTVADSSASSSTRQVSLSGSSVQTGDDIRHADSWELGKDTGYREIVAQNDRGFLEDLFQLPPEEFGARSLEVARNLAETANTIATDRGFVTDTAGEFDSRSMSGRVSGGFPLFKGVGVSGSVEGTRGSQSGVTEGRSFDVDRNAEAVRDILESGYETYNTTQRNDPFTGEAEPLSASMRDVYRSTALSRAHDGIRGGFETLDLMAGDTQSRTDNPDDDIGLRIKTVDQQRRERSAGRPTADANEEDGSVLDSLKFWNSDDE